MMIAVFNDIKNFFILWLLLITWFSFVFAILFRLTPLATYSDLGDISYFIYTFRVSAGDFELEPITE